MARYRSRRQGMYSWLREHHLTPFEARAYSVLPKRTPALRALIADRDARWERFQKIADRKVERKEWKKGVVSKKWVTNLKRMYRKRGWVAQKGPRGAPSPWATYRDYERRTPDKGYQSPWEIKVVKAGGSSFNRGQIFVQKAQRSGNKAQIQHWIHQLDESIRISRGANRERFREQRERLRRML